MKYDMEKEYNIIKLYNGNCIDIMKIMDDNSIDHVICDLPYYKVVKDEFDNQWKNLDEYLSFIKQCIIEINRVLKPNGNIIIFTSRQYNRHICNILDEFFIEKRIIIWSRKRGFNNTRGKALASGYEPICYYCNGEQGTFNNIKIKPKTDRKEYTDGILKDGICLSDVWDDIPALPHNAKEKTEHPTQKPIKLMERIISLFTNENDIILDFCMGSGSTGVAAIKQNRKFVGIELDNNYFEIASNRINKELNKINSRS